MNGWSRCNFPIPRAKSLCNNGGSCNGFHLPTSGGTAFGDGPTFWSNKRTMETRVTESNDLNEGIISVQKDKLLELQTQIENIGRNTDDHISEMKTIIATMLTAIKRQPNVNNSIKQGLPKLEELLDSLTFKSRELESTNNLITEIMLNTKLSILKRTRANSVPTTGQEKRTALSPPTQQGQPNKKRKEDPLEENEKWSKVTKKRKKKLKNKPEENVDKQVPVGEKSSTKKMGGRKKAKPDALLLKPSKGKTYAEIVNAIHLGIRPDEAQLDVRSVRKTRAGAVLLELGKTTPEIKAKFSEALKKAVGQNSSVMELTPKVTIEVRDFDCCTNEQEIEEALKKNLENYNGAIQVRLTKPNIRQQRLAFIRLEESVALKILEVGRIKIGFVSCRIRRSIELRRCFRCLAFGHYSSNCKGQDRSKNCFRCGITGHKADECRADPICFLCSPEHPNNAKHIAGSRACQAYQKELSEIRKK